MRPLFFTDPVTAASRSATAFSACDESAYRANDTVRACFEVGSHHSRQSVGNVAPPLVLPGSRRYSSGLTGI